MKKVVYSISKLSRFGSTKMTGVGFITDEDLIIACVSQKGNPYIRVFEDCVKNCHAIPNRDGEFKGAHYEIREIEVETKTAAASSPVTTNAKSRSNIPYGTSWSDRRHNMKNKFYLKEFQFFDGENTVVFNILSVEGSKITVAVTKCGKISVSNYELHTDKNGLYFEYGVAGKEHIHIDDFEEAE